MLFLAQHGISVKFTTAGWLQLAAQLTKYIPGKIWSAALQAHLSGTVRIGGVFLAGLDTSIFLMITLSGLGIAILAVQLNWLGAIAAFTISLLAVSFISSKALLAKLASRLSRRLTGQIYTLNSTGGPHLSLVSFFGSGLLHSAAHSASIVILLMSTTDFDSQSLLIATASILLAWVIGNLAVMVPSGLGIREITFIGLSQQLDHSVEIETLVAVAILVRLAQLVQDVITAVFVMPTVFISSKSLKD